MTTAGVVSPLNNDPSYVATTLFVLVGVPLNGYMWGLWADWVLEPYIRATYIFYLPQRHTRIYVRLLQALKRARDSCFRTMQERFKVDDVK